MTAARWCKADTGTIMRSADREEMKEGGKEPEKEKETDEERLAARPTVG